MLICESHSWAKKDATHEKGHLRIGSGSWPNIKQTTFHLRWERVAATLGVIDNTLQLAL
jgi:hypothetical protein